MSEHAAPVIGRPTAGHHEPARREPPTGEMSALGVPGALLARSKADPGSWGRIVSTHVMIAHGGASITIAVHDRRGPVCPPVARGRIVSSHGSGTDRPLRRPGPGAAPVRRPEESQ